LVELDNTFTTNEYRKMVKIVIVIVSYLKYYLYKLGQTDNATCRLCKGADETETAEHILCTCDAISLKRLLYLGKANLTPEEVVSVASRQVLYFFGSRELP